MRLEVRVGEDMVAVEAPDRDQLRALIGTALVTRRQLQGGPLLHPPQPEPKRVCSKCHEGYRSFTHREKCMPQAVSSRRGRRGQVAGVKLDYNTDPPVVEGEVLDLAECSVLVNDLDGSRTVLVLGSGLADQGHLTHHYKLPDDTPHDGILLGRCACKSTQKFRA